MIEKLLWMAVMIALGFLVMSAHGQSSSLYGEVPPARLTPGPTTLEDRLSPRIAELSYTAVNAPPPRRFAVHDLVTIIVRENTKSESDAKLDTQKKSEIDGSISSFPSLSLADLLKLHVEGSTLTNPPKVGVSFDNQFQGDGTYEREDTFTSRLQARVIDVKPNGTLVLEARKFIKSDKEELEMVVTGLCRAEDVTLDNAVLSTQLYDLRLVKNHKGELRSSTKKGLLTKLFEAIFNF
jgi:flagellar L-ring protein precursor FlgH